MYWTSMDFFCKSSQTSLSLSVLAVNHCGSGAPHTTLGPRDENKVTSPVSSIEIFLNPNGSGEFKPDPFHILRKPNSAGRRSWEVQTSSGRTSGSKAVCDKENNLPS